MALTIRVRPKFPARLLGSSSVSITKVGGTFTWSLSAALESIGTLSGTGILHISSGIITASDVAFSDITPVGAFTLVGNSTGVSADLAEVPVNQSLAFTGGSIYATGLPVSDDGAALGSTAQRWSDVFFASGAVINFASNDVNITHSTDQLAFNGAGNGYFFDATIQPVASDGASLGTSTKMFSDLFLASGAVVNFNNGDVTVTHAADKLSFAGAASGYTLDGLLVVGHTANLSIGGSASNAEIVGTTTATASLGIAGFSTTAATAPNIHFYRSKNASIGSATVVASGDVLGEITWYGAQQTGTFSNQNPAARLRAEADGTVSDGAGADMPGRLVFSTTQDATGSLTDRLVLDSAGILRPNANDSASLGVSGTAFSDLFLASGGVINWAANDVNITHSADQLSFAGASIYFFDGSIQPTANDGAALGSTSKQFSDLFLATGGVLNWNNGTVTLTQTGDAIINSGFYNSTGGFKRTTSQFDVTSSTTLANIPGLSVTVAAGDTYQFEATLFCSHNASGGTQFAIGGTATATSIIVAGLKDDQPNASSAGSSYAVGRVTSLGATILGSTNGTKHGAKLWGIITVNAGGTLTVQFAQNASFGTASSVLVGSYFMVVKIS